MRVGNVNLISITVGWKEVGVRYKTRDYYVLFVCLTHSTFLALDNVKKCGSNLMKFVCPQFRVWHSTYAHRTRCQMCAYAKRDSVLMGNRAAVSLDTELWVCLTKIFSTFINLIWVRLLHYNGSLLHLHTQPHTLCVFFVCEKYRFISRSANWRVYGGRRDAATVEIGLWSGRDWHEPTTQTANSNWFVLSWFTGPVRACGQIIMVYFVFVHKHLLLYSQVDGINKQS